VFRGYGADRKRHVAIKAFKLDLPPERVHQFVAELERVVAAGLTRSGIAAPLAAGVAHNTPYLAQEFVAADSLDVLVRDYGPAPPADGLQVAVQLAGALDFAAVVNVLHGALHPRDLLLSSDESRMTGLGVSRALERAGVTPPVRRPYTAPERIAGAAWDRRADIFSLAAIVYEMLWGRRVQGTGTDAVAGLTDLPGADLASLRSTFARALAEKPQARFDTALEFAAALKQGFPGVARAENRDVRRATPEPAPRLPLEPPPAPVPDPGEIDLRPAEAVRFRDVEPGPAIIAPGLASRSSHQAAPSESMRPRADGSAPSPLISERVEGMGTVLGLEQSAATQSALDRTRSAIWPLVMALIVGLALGFAGVYGVGNRERTLASVLVAPSPASGADVQQPPAAQPAPTTGREFTEGAVPETPRPAVPTEPPPAATRPEPAATSGRSTVAADTGRLLVRSTPAGAHVFVDGRERGRTPAAVHDLAHGTHHVRVVQDGYATQERRVTLTRSKPSQSISVALARARAETPAQSAAASHTPVDMQRRSSAESFSGSLSVDSLPTGAKVFVDGKLAGTTPVVLPQVTAGEHVVRIEQDGYRRWSSSVRIVSGERNRVTASLEK